MSNPIKNKMTAMPHSIGHDISTEKAMELMSTHSFHHLPVLDGGKLIGIISDQDLLKFSNLNDLKVKDIMTEDPVVIEPEMDVFQVIMMMQQKRIGSVIISANKTSPWGIFTATDALAYLTKDKVKLD